MNLIHVLNCRSVEMNLKKVFFKQRATGWPDVLMGPVLNGLARPVNRPTDRAWACKQTRCPIGARPGGTPCQSGPCPYGPCLARARAGPCRAGPLLNFRYKAFSPCFSALVVDSHYELKRVFLDTIFQRRVCLDIFPEKCMLEKYV